MNPETRVTVLTGLTIAAMLTGFLILATALSGCDRTREAWNQTKETVRGLGG